MKLHKILQTVLTLFALVFLASCSVDDPNFESDSSFISVKVFSIPASYDHVFIELSEVLVKVLEDESDPKCWIRLPVSNPGIYDLNRLIAGNDVLLLDQIKLQSGQIHAIKLVLGENNYMIKDDQRYDLFTNIVQQEGLNLKIDTFFNENETYTYLLDFDVENSIIETYIEDHYVLRPKIRPSLEKRTGSIQGNLISEGKDAMILATKGEDTVVTKADLNGDFILRGLGEGNYDLTIILEGENLQNISLSQINVEKQNITHLGQIDLTE